LQPVKLDTTVRFVMQLVLEDSTAMQAFVRELRGLVLAVSPTDMATIVKMSATTVSMVYACK